MPFDERGVAEAAHHLVWTARIAADSAAVVAVDMQARERRDIVARYLSRTRATIEAFRAEVPSVSSEASYDLTRSRDELQAADDARRQLLDVAAAVAFDLHDSLRLSARYLDEFEAAVEAVEAREPQQAPVQFLARYEALVDAHNAWANASGAAVERLNRDLDATIAHPDEDAAIAALLRSGWPRALLVACDDALQARIDGAALGARVLELEERLANGLARAKPALGPCVDAAAPMLEAFGACAEAVHDPDREPLELMTLHKSFLGRVAEFEAIRQTVCAAE